MSGENLQDKSSNKDTLRDYFSYVVSAPIQENHPALLGIKLSLLTGEEGREDIPIGLLRFLSLQDVKALQQAKKKEKSQFSNLLLQLSVERALDRVDHLISFYQEQMEFLLDQIQEHQERLEILQEQNDALENLLDQYRETGQVNWKSPGQLQNPAANDALQAYLQSHATDLETADVYLLLLNVQANVQEQTEAIEQSIGEDSNKYELYQFNWEQAQAVKEDLQSGDPQLQVAALEALSTIEKDMQIALEIETKQGLQDEYEVVKPQDINSAAGDNNDMEPIDLLADLEPLEAPGKANSSNVPKP